MSRNVMIDGVRYVPVSKKPNVYHIQELSKILSTKTYLSKVARDEIIKEFKMDESEKPRKSVKPKTKTSRSSKGINTKNIEGVDDKGHLKLKKGGRGGKKTTWTIQQAIDIKQHRDFGSKGKTTVSQLAKNFNLNIPVVKTILDSWDEGSLQRYVDEWHSRNSKGVQVPIQNNPEKRRELGYYG